MLTPLCAAATFAFTVEAKGRARCLLGNKYSGVLVAAAALPTAEERTEFDYYNLEHSDGSCTT